MKNVTSRTYNSTDYITVSELKSHLRVLSSDDDTYITTLLDSCFDYASQIVGYEIRKSTVDYFFSDSDLHIPARILSVTSVSYRNANATVTALASTDYDTITTISANYGYDVTLINAPSSLYDYGWKYKVTVVEGFAKSGDSVDVSKIFPASLRAAIYMLAEHLYTNRGSQVVGTTTSKLDWNHEHLFAPFSIKEYA